MEINCLEYTQNIYFSDNTQNIKGRQGNFRPVKQKNGNSNQQNKKTFE